MRYALGLASVLSVLLVWPLSVGAQAADERDSAVEQSHPEASVDPTKPEGASEPALKLGLDSSGLEVTPAAPPTLEELKPQEKKRRMSRQGRIVVGVIVPVVVIGVVAGAAVGVSKNSNWGEF